jgi:hypothetical protein
MSEDEPEDGDVVIGTRARIIAILKPDGRLVYGDGYNPDEAASALWQALARQLVEAGGSAPAVMKLAAPDEVGLLGMEERFNEWEPAMIALARAAAALDLAIERRNRLIGAVTETSPRMRQAEVWLAQCQSEADERVSTIARLAQEHGRRKGALQTVAAEHAVPDPTTAEGATKKVLN